MNSFLQKKLRLLAIIAIVAMAGIMFTACGGDDEETLQKRDLTIAGTFASQNGGEQAKFFATAGRGAVAQSRSISARDFALEGFLEDGDITFRLNGNYNSDTGTYTLSAASSFLRYTITGSFNDLGIAETGRAIVQVRSGDEWITTEVPITTTGTAPPINTGGVIVDETSGGIPQNMRGIWRDTNDANYYAMVNAFSVVFYERIGNNWIEAETMFFTDINTANGITSGITAYMDWDFDEISNSNPNWWFDMISDYAEENDIKFVSNSIDLEVMFYMTEQAQAIINKYNVQQQYSWHFPLNVTEEAITAFYETYSEWAEIWRSRRASLMYPLGRIAYLTEGPGKEIFELLGFGLENYWHFSPEADQEARDQFNNNFNIWYTQYLETTGKTDNFITEFEAMVYYWDEPGREACEAIEAIMDNRWTGIPFGQLHEYDGPFQTWLHGIWYPENYSDSTNEEMLAYFEGDGKEACEALGIMIRILILPAEIHPPGSGIFDDEAQVACMMELSVALEAWIASQGYILPHVLSEMMRAENYEDKWLTAKYGKDSSYWIQFYSKMGLRLQGGRLIPGEFYKPGSGPCEIHGEMVDFGCDICNNRVFPVYSVKNYSEVHSTLTHVEWWEYGLRR
jgi:hypothetical protein